MNINKLMKKKHFFLKLKIFSLSWTLYSKNHPTKNKKIEPLRKDLNIKSKYNTKWNVVDFA